MKKDLRHRAREAALQILYQWEIGRGDVDRAIDTFFERQWPGADPPPAALRTFASTLARDTVNRLDRADSLIAGTSERWRPERMAVIDRTLLRMAAYELLESPDIPVGPIVSEAVELAKRFSTEDSGRFVNGVLGALARDLRPPAPTR